MSAALVFGDLHIAYLSDWSKPSGPGQSQLLDLYVATFDWLLRLATGVDYVVFLGDLFDRAETIPTACLHVAASGFRRLAKGRQLRVLLGNHDCLTADGSVSSVSFLGLIPDAKVVAREECEDWDGLRVGYVPYPSDKKRALEHFRSERVRLVFAHVPVRGGLLRPGQRDTGPDMSDQEFVTGSVAATFFGHYHHPDGTDRIVYVGSPVYRHWGDDVVDIPRGAVIVAWDTPTKIRVHRYRNPHTFVFRSLELDEDTDLASLLKSLAGYDLDRTWIRCTFHPSRRSDAELLREKLDGRVRGLKLAPRAVPSPSPPTREPATPQRMLESWVETHPPERDRDTVVREGLALLDASMRGGDD